MAYNKETGLYEGFIYKIWNDVNNKIYVGQTTTTLQDRWHGHLSSRLNPGRNHNCLYRDMRDFGVDKFHIEAIEKFEAQNKEELIKLLNYAEICAIGRYSSAEYNGGYNIELGGDNKHVEGRYVCKYDDDLNLLETYDSIREAARCNNIDNTTIWAVCKHYYYKAAGYIWAYQGETPIKPDYEDIRKRGDEKRKAACAERRKTHPPKPHKSPKSRAMSVDLKRQRHLEQLNWNGKRIVVYNAFGKVVNIYKDLIDASEGLSISVTELKRNLDGRNLSFKKFVLRYEGDDFNKFPRSNKLQPITLYDLDGNYVADFETIIDAEAFMGCPRGEVLKVLKRGGTCHDYILTRYGEPIQRKLKRDKVRVEQYDLNDNFIQEFNTEKDAFDSLEKPCSIKSLRKAMNYGNEYKGFYWKRIQEYGLEERENDNETYAIYS